MRLYGKRFIANRTEARIQDRKESRDAIVYDIDESNRWCRVRVAGSNILVRAWFPANFMRAPVWLKTGTAVRIAHVGGDKSRIEAIAPGLVQPTAVMPPLQGGVDAIMIGMYPTAPTETTGWVVDISTGTYRIGGALYRFVPGGPNMDEENWHMGDGGDMSGTYWWGAVDPISAHDEGELWFRYDAFFVGTDGVVDYVKGDEWEWTGVYGGVEGPVKPATPVNHILIRNYILVWTGLTGITQTNIGKEFDAPHPETLVTNYEYSEPYYPATDAYAREIPGDGVGVIYGGPDVYQSAGGGAPLRGSLQQDMQASGSVTVMDQYGNPFGWWSSGSVNQLAIKFLGAAGGYGNVGTGIGTSVPDDGTEALVSLGLGHTFNFGYIRQHHTVEQPDSEGAGYPEYEESDADSHTAVLNVRLISAQATHPVTTFLTFWNLDRSGIPQ
jgi:hypothetical protein